MKSNKTKIRSVMQKCVWSLSTLGAVIGLAIATLTISPANAKGTQNIESSIGVSVSFFLTLCYTSTHPRHGRCVKPCAGASEEGRSGSKKRCRHPTAARRKQTFIGQPFIYENL